MTGRIIRGTNMWINCQSGFNRESRTVSRHHSLCACINLHNTNKSSIEYCHYVLNIAGSLQLATSMSRRKYWKRNIILLSAWKAQHNPPPQYGSPIENRRGLSINQSIDHIHDWAEATANYLKRHWFPRLSICIISQYTIYSYNLFTLPPQFQR